MKNGVYLKANGDLLLLSGWPYKWDNYCWLSTVVTVNGEIYRSSREVKSLLEDCEYLGKLK